MTVNPEEPNESHGKSTKTIASVSFAISLLSFGISAANLYYTDRAVRDSADQLAIARFANDQTLNADIPRLTLLPGKKPNSFILRNIGNQPAYSIVWVALAVDTQGHPTDYTNRTQMSLLMPSGLGTQDEASITVDQRTVQKVAHDGLYALIVRYWGTATIKEHTSTEFFIREGKPEDQTDLGSDSPDVQSGATNK